MALVVGVVDPARTVTLRWQVLRPHQSVESVAGERWPEGARTFGASESTDGPVLATATVYPEQPPGTMTPVVELARGGQPWRLRGVATAEGHRSRGLGRLVMGAIVAYLAERDAVVCWCYARLAAREFYLREGFTAFGEVFPVEEIGPHLVMYRPLLESPAREDTTAP